LCVASQAHEKGILAFMNINFNLEAREIYLEGGKPAIIDLTPLEAKVFNVLWENKNKTVERFDIELKVWGDELEQLRGSNTVDVYIGYLRRKLWAKFKIRHPILTIRGRGYRLEVSDANQ
jgi:DNA-binding response OmpR family regulator